MGKLDEIKATLDKLYGHLAMVEVAKEEYIHQGIKIGTESGYRLGFEAGFAEGFAEGKIFPDAHQSAPSIDDARMRLTRNKNPG